MQLRLPHELPRPPADDDVPDLPRRAAPSPAPAIHGGESPSG